MNTLTHARLKTLICYNPETGNFWWPDKARKCTSITSSGYVRVVIEGKEYLAHRLAWFWVKGVWPAVDIDHEDRDKTNNRFKNLREATESENGQNRLLPMSNNSTGYLGVVPVKGKFQARIQVNGMTINLGSFNEPEVAHHVYSCYKKSIHPFAPK